MNKKFAAFLILLLIGVIAIFGYYEYSVKMLRKNTVNNFQNREEQTFQQEQTTSTAILPTENGLTTSTENVFFPILEKKDEITVSSIQDNQEISSPVVIEGEAKKEWFFEGQFPVYIMDNERRIVGNGNAVAKENGMNDDVIPFIATIDFNADAPTGFIILEKNNPSGLAEKKVSVQIPVQLIQKPLVREAGGCKISGCSGQICSDQDVPSNCMYKEEYICYQKAKCERQSTGECGWTPTRVLTQCLEQFAE